MYGLHSQVILCFIAMLHMCTQTRPRFKLSSEGVGNVELSFFPKGTSRWFVQGLLKLNAALLFAVGLTTLALRHPSPLLL